MKKHYNNQQKLKNSIDKWLQIVIIMSSNRTPIKRR